MGAALHTRIFDQADAFAQLRDSWNALLGKSETNVVFLSWEWQHTWWSVYQAGQLWIVGVYQEDHLVGLAPWFIQHRDGEAIVRTIGCVDVTDYVDVIADRAHIAEVQAVLAQFLHEHRSRFTRINLCNIPEASPTKEHMPDLLRDLGFEADTVLQEVCPIIHLPDEFESYLDMLDKKQRHELRRKMRKAENEAELTWTVVGPDDDLNAYTDQFLALMAESQPAKAEFLSDARNEQFFRAIVAATHARGWLRLSFLAVDGVMCAAYCDFDYNGHILVYNSGLRLDTAAHLSPGIVLLCYNIRAAIESGHTLFDFLRGNEGYKYRMGARDTRVFKLVARVRERDGVPG